MLKSNKIFLLLCIASFFSITSIDAAATDSTAVTASKPTPAMGTSYTLYQSEIKYYSNDTSVLNPPSYFLTSTIYKRCLPGYSACLFIDIVNSGVMNSSSCRLQQVFTDVKITKVGTNSYTIYYQYGYTLAKSSAFITYCPTAKGSFTYTVNCIPNDNVDPNAYGVTNNIGPICVK